MSLSDSQQTHALLLISAMRDRIKQIQRDFTMLVDAVDEFKRDVDAMRRSNINSISDLAKSIKLHEAMSGRHG